MDSYLQVPIIGQFCANTRKESDNMKKHRLRFTVFIFFLASVVLITACEEAASNFTDRTIQNLEDDVGGAAERSRENATDKAGGEICGSNVAMILLFIGAPAFITLRRPASKIDARGNRKMRSPSNRKADSEKHEQEENDDGSGS